MAATITSECRFPVLLIDGLIWCKSPDQDKLLKLMTAFFLALSGRRWSLYTTCNSSINCRAMRLYKAHAREGPGVEHSTSWTFLSNHAHVLICLHRDPGLRMREIALQVGITERAVQRIVAELVESGFMSVSKDGRRNVYEIHEDLRLRHPVEKHKQISDLLRLVD